MTVSMNSKSIDQLEQVRLGAMASRPTQTLERAISHVGKQPCYATGDAIKLMGRLICAIRTETNKAMAA